MKRYPDIDNRTLVEDCIKGDRDALNMLYTRFAPKMLGVIRRYVPNPDDSEDILHDGFIVAYTRLSSLRDFNRIDVWLATIMKNLALRFLNSQDVTAILHELPDVPDIPEIEEIIDLETLEKLMLRLPDGYRKVFRLAVLENKSHKEIGKLLGIAPNSSSSQLFHARMMMRKLITDYKRETDLISALILIATCSLPLILRFNRDENPAIDNTTALLDRSSTPPTANTISPHLSVETSTAPSAPIQPQPSAKTLAYTPDSCDTTAAVQPADSTSTEKSTFPPAGNDKLLTELGMPRLSASPTSAEKCPEPLDSTLQYQDMSAWPYLADYTPVTSRRDAGWSLALGVNPGILNFKNPAGDSDIAFNPGPGDNDPDNPSEDKTPPVVELPARYSPGKGFSDYADQPHHNHLPISFSLAVNRRLYRSISIGSGLTYTYLRTSFESRHAESMCHWHYLGIPVKIDFLTFSSGIFKGYASLGARLDIPLGSRASVSSKDGEPDLCEGSFRSPLVWSLSASYGISLKLSDKVDIFAEPSLQYRFDHDATVPNIWSDNPWGFSLPIGIRFNW